MNILKLYIVLVLSFGGFIAANAQFCRSKKLASKEMKGDYDYREGSTFVELVNGQEATYDIVLYSKQNYRLFVVAEQKLGGFSYQVHASRKKFNRVLKGINLKKVPVYKKDPSGFYLYDNSGKRIVTGDMMVPDTVWARETSDIVELVYDSKSNETPYWQATPIKTQIVKVTVKIDPASKINSGCVGIFVGREFANAYQFRR